MNSLEPVLNDPPATTTQSELRRGAVAALPVLLGFIRFALVLGAQASQHQLATGEVALMTGLNFGGGSEFAAVELWTSPPAIGWATWVTFTSLGAQVGPLLGDLRSYGFDMAFAAVFLVLLKGMWKGVHAALPWLFSLLTAALFYLLIPGGWYVLAGTVAGLVTAYLWAKP
ncbi:branched-chain amino acid ABC transporter permease [Pseudomonas putida]|nr:branched-chain amino acid ABC transporter permease [Pseudomonas putida]